MKISKLVILSCMLLGLVLVAQAKTQKIVGVVAGVSKDSIQVTTKNEATESVALDDKTSYVKWITHRPWGQDTRADRSSLLIGRCVNIEVREGQPTTAKRVQVNDDPAGSIWDPCHR